MATWRSTSAVPAPERPSTGATGLAKIIRTCASVSALPVGEIDAIHAGRVGRGNASTGPSFLTFGPGPAHEASEAAARTTKCRLKRRNDRLLMGATGLSASYIPCR